MIDLITVCLQGVYWTFSGCVNGPACLSSHSSGQLCSLLCNWQICCFDALESRFKRKNEVTVMRRAVRITCLLGVGPLCWCSSENPIKQSKVLNSKANMPLRAVGRVRHSGSDATYPSC